MKKMQDFHKRLSSVNEESASEERCLASLTRLDRAQLLNAAGNLVWDIWGAAS